MGILDRVGGVVKDVGKGTVNLVESGYNAAKKGVGDLDVNDLLDMSKGLFSGAGDFLRDPVGYIEKQYDNLSFTTITNAVSLGLDDVVAGMAREAGLGPLIDAVDDFVDEIEEVVSIVLQMVRCAAWAENPTFWAVVAGISAARATGLVKHKSDCKKFVTGGEFARALGATSVPLLDLLPCAIEAAFMIPVPSASGARPRVPGAKVGARAAGALSSSVFGRAAAVVGSPSLSKIRNAARPFTIGAVSRSKDKLDIMLARADGAVVTAAWQPGDTKWRGWWPVANSRSTPGTPVTAVSRSKDKLDIFMVGLDGRIWTAAWQAGDTAWRGWWPVGNLKSVPGTPVGAVSRSADKLDLFVTGADGHVHTAAWQAGDTAWRGWWSVANGRSTPGAPVTAVSRSKDKLDIFMTGLDGRIWTAAWQPGDTAWRGWWAIGDLEVAPMSLVNCVSRSADKLDLFVCGTNRAVYSAAWQAGDANWRGWWQLS